MIAQIAVSNTLRKVYPSLPLRVPGTSYIAVLRLTSDVGPGDALIYGIRYATFSNVAMAHEYLTELITTMGEFYTGPPLEQLDREYTEFIKCEPRNPLHIVGR